MRSRSINSFCDHAPKTSWFISFFQAKDNFFSDNSLSSAQLIKFKVFLSDSLLSEKNRFSSFAKLILKIGWETDIAQGLILINLIAKNPQIKWYVKNLNIGHSYSRKYVIEKLVADGLKTRPANSVARSFKRIAESPLSTSLHFGHVTKRGDLVRTKCIVTDPRVLLYGLFKFAEKCNDFKEFTLATLLNDGIERDGISPTRIFGLDREDVTPMLIGLSAKYHEFITASFTHDLEKITLSENKTSKDVLGLFSGGM